MSDFKPGDEVQHRRRPGKRYKVVSGPARNEVSEREGYLIRNARTDEVMWTDADSLMPAPPETFNVAVTKAEAAFLAACLEPCTGAGPLYSRLLELGIDRYDAALDELYSPIVRDALCDALKAARS